MAKLHKATFQMTKMESIPLKISNVSLISSKGIADGKLLPIIFLDCTERPDIDKVFIDHKNLKEFSGDVETCFGFKSRFNKSSILLHIMLKKPIKFTIIIDFILSKDSSALDLLIRHQGCYIQSNSQGNSFVESADSPRILVEIPSDQISEAWEKIYFNSMKKNFLKKGFNKAKSIELATSLINELRKIDIRM